jgi:NitT/TauT family transport system permease protein
VGSRRPLQNNDLLLPSFLQTGHALYDGLLSGELLGKVWIRWWC